MVFPMTSTTSREHLHSGTLTALLAHDTRPSKSQVASALGITPANLRELETGVRSGATIKTRRLIAGYFNVQVPQVSCWCDRPDGRCRSAVA